MSASTGPLPEPILGTLRFTGGRQVKDTAPWAMLLTPPSQAAYVRKEEQLALLLDLSGPSAYRLQRELREIFARTYWLATGSITAALRQAAFAANQHLLQYNLQSTPTGRHEGGLACAVLRGEDAFILRAGRSCVLFYHHEQGYLMDFSSFEELPALGSASPLEVRLHHTFVAPGDKMLMASSSLIEGTDSASLSRVLAMPDKEDVLAGVERIAGTDNFSVLLLHWPLYEERSAAQEIPSSLEKQERPTLLSRLRPSVSTVREMATDTVESTPLAPEPPATEKYQTRIEPGEWVKETLQVAGVGIIAAGSALARGTRTMLRNILPASRSTARPRARPAVTPAPARQAPVENRTAMMLAAIVIPIVLAIIVLVAYLSFGETARLQSLIHQAEQEITLAQAAGGSTEGARPHWEAALYYAGEVLKLRPDQPVATALKKQAQDALDLLDNIVRLSPVLLKDFGPGGGPHRIAVHGQSIFVMNPADGWVSRLTLTSSGDSVLEQDSIPVLVRTGQSVGESRVGKLVDLVWVDLAGGRQSSGLVVLEAEGALVCYDPAWEDASGKIPLKRTFLGTPPESPLSIDTYEGRLYILDGAANQIRRYEPAGDTYPDQPEHYFVNPPPRPLTEALDMAIDGFVYIIYNDGEIRKFLRGEPQPFKVEGVPNGLSQPVALAVDPHGSSGVIYVADRGNRRVVALGPDGTFWTQFYAGEAFDALETLAVDESARLLYAVSAGRLYAARLPLP